MAKLIADRIVAVAAAAFAISWIRRSVSWSGPTVAAMKEEDAYDWFLRARWPSTNGVPVCPKCGVLGASPFRNRRFRCPASQCRAEFSVTSGTILASRKLPVRTLLLAIALSVMSVKGTGNLSQEPGRRTPPGAPVWRQGRSAPSRDLRA
jgi:hypothetical protein